VNEAVRTEPVTDTRELRRTLGQFATGVTIVTCLSDEGEPVGMTANSFSSVSLDPPLVLWSLDRKARSFPVFAGARHFAFSVLSQDQVELSNRFAQPGAAKFCDLDWHAGLGGVPLIPDPAAHFECTQHAAFDGGDHLIIVGRVERFVRYDRRALVFAHGRYGAVAPHPGSAVSHPAEATDDRHPYDDFLVPLLFRAYNHVFRAFQETLVAEEATGPQMRILSILSASGPTATDELLTRTMLSHTTYTEARDGLVRAGFVECHADEALAITPAGEAKLNDLLRRAAERERLSTADLDAAEVEMLRALLRKLVLHHEGEEE
jgi:flavin reductase (DIM6/NTAB) family NADH-FMN oxidoreductase RutF/DNA-binding MarR family transcriptional regulator